MKTRLLIPLVFVAFLFSCKDDEDVSASVVGIWKGDRADINVTYGVIPVYGEDDEDFNVTLQFKEDGTVIFKRDGQETTGTYSVNGKKLTTDVDLQIYETSGSTTFDIEELTTTELKLHLDEEREVNVPDFGNIEVTVKADLEFDRM